MEYLEIITRWVHVIAAIMWVGATLVFMRMERNLLTTHDPLIQGQEDQIHGGAIWRMMKFKTIPPGSKKLHWFMYESLVTFITGIILLIIIYWTGGLMIFPESDLSVLESVFIGVSVILGGFILYQFFWKLIKPGQYDIAGGIFCFIVITILSYWLCKYLSGRSAYIHIGAMLGTIMVTNVWMTIIPSQKEMVKKIQNGETPDDNLAARAGRASTHNTYIMVPLVLIMIGNHYPVAMYGSSNNWIVLSVMILLGWMGGHLIRKKF